MVDALEPEQVCQHAISDGANPENVAWRFKLPHILHYCQRYYIGPYFFNKYKLPHDFLTCDHPLLLDPADDAGVVALTYHSSVTPDGTVYELTPADRKRHAFFVCHMIAKINDAATFWKERHCGAASASGAAASASANLSKVYVVPKDQKRKRGGK